MERGASEIDMNKRERRAVQIVGAEDALERAYKVHERAATQFHKLVGTILGGLGVILAAWLQRIFEKPEPGLLHDLLWYLGGALAAVVFGFMFLASATLLDKWSANTFAGAVQFNKARLLTRIRISQIRRQLPPGDKRSAQELEQAHKLEQLGDKAQAQEARAQTINRWSWSLEIGTLTCLVVAFGILAWGVLSTVHKTLAGKASDTVTFRGTLTAPAPTSAEGKRH
jgi:hypothetical protein